MFLFGKKNKYGNLSDEELQRKIDGLLSTNSRYDALPMAEEFIRRNPTDPRGYQMKAYAIFQKDPLEAARTLSKACEYAGDLYSYGLYLADQAHFYYYAGDYDTALQGFQAWWDGYQKGNFDKSDMAVFGYALTLRRLGRSTDALITIGNYRPSREGGDLAELLDELVKGISLEDSQFA